MKLIRIGDTDYPALRLNSFWLNGCTVSFDFEGEAGCIHEKFSSPENAEKAFYEWMECLESPEKAFYEWMERLESLEGEE